MGSFYVGLAKVAIRRPWLIPTMLGAAWAFRANRWYRRPPFLPLPSKVYMRWRMETAYGRNGAVVPLEVPVRCTCRDYGGRSGTWAEPCARCQGSGV